MTAGPLDGIRVLDLGTVGPGARACRTLSDLGARITRLVPPAGIGTNLPFYAYGGLRGFERCSLDLRHPEGRAVARDLAGASDVVVEGFRPGVADRLGVGYSALRAANPALVYCAATGYGQDGPWAARAGHDLNYQGVAGYLASTEPAADGGPPLPGTTAADAAGGMQAALAIVAALFARSRTGAGAYLDVAAVDGMLGLMAMHLENHLATGAEIGPGSDVLTGAYACYAIYECADGRWISVAAIEEKFFASLCAALDVGSLAAAQYDPSRQDELRAALATTFRGRTRDEWIEAVGDRDTCVAPVLSVGEVVHTEHFLARGRFVAAVHPEHGELRQLGPVTAGTVRPAEPVPLNAAGATETDQVLAAIGYDSARIAALRTAGVIA